LKLSTGMFEYRGFPSPGSSSPSIVTGLLCDEQTVSQVRHPVHLL